MENIIASIDIETTGLDPHRHDIIEIAILPLDGMLKPSETIQPFTARIKARRPQNIEQKALEVNGLDPSDGEEYHEVLARLLAWLEEYGIGTIDLLGQNVDFDRSFIEEQFPELAARCGHRNIRDSQRLARAFNDIVLLRTGETAFGQLGLSDLRKALGIDCSREHRALDDARDAALVYRTLLGKMNADWRPADMRQSLQAESPDGHDSCAVCDDESIMEKIRENDFEKWEMEKECDICHCRIKGELFDAHRRDRPLEWATMCAKCFGRYGIRLGIGYGQRYVEGKDGEFYLVDGKDSTTEG